MIAAALACECPQTRRKQLRETGLGIGDGESSTGHKQRRADAKAMEEQMEEQVDHDAVKHLELLEYMLSKYKTDHPTVLPRNRAERGTAQNTEPGTGCAVQAAKAAKAAATKAKAKAEAAKAAAKAAIDARRRRRGSPPRPRLGQSGTASAV